MLDIEFHPDVAKEIKSSYQWYQNQTGGLGQDYLSELESSFQTIHGFRLHGLSFKKVSAGFF
jgi:hypothetical protein